VIGRQDDPLKQFGERVQTAINQQAKRTGDLEKKVEGISRYLANQHSTSEADQTMADIQRKEEHYTQVVMLAGYGAFFALWTQTRSEMSLWMFASTGALICVSLLTFVGFELYKSWRMGGFFSRHKSPSVREINDEVELINKHWRLVFGVSAGTGLLSGMSLLLWFVYKTIVAASQLSGAA
jgi:hypothetical protein